MIMKTTKKKPAKRKTLEKPLKLNMSFDEAMKRIVKTDKTKKK